MNKTFVSGNLTRDPELRQTQGGGSVLTFGVAVNDRKRNAQTGEWEDVPNFFDCCVFGKRADSLANLLHKGMRVCIDGKLRWSQWQDKQSGQKRSKVEIVVDDIVFMSDSKAHSGQQGQQPNNYAQQAQSAPNMAPQRPTGGVSDVYDEDIPFS